MKKLILGLLCIGSILALPGCCCRRTCEEPCEENYDDCYDDCENDYCDDGYNDHDGKELVGYEEQQGYRRNIYRKNAPREEVVSQGPRKATYHKPIHPAVIERCEVEGKSVKYLDKRFENQNMQMRKAAEVQEKPMVPARQSRKSMRESAASMEMDE